MDFGAPVGQDVNVSPQQGLQTLSGILSLKQQQQGLQIGQQALTADTAHAQQAQQQNTEMQQAQSLLQKVHQGGYRDQNGDLDSQKLSTDLAAIGPYAGAAASNVIGVGNEIVKNQAAKQGLTEDSREELGNTLTSLASNPATHRGDVVDAMTGFIQNHANDPNAIRVATAQLALLPQDDGTPNFRTMLSNFAGALTGKPQSAPAQIDTNAAIQPGQTLNATGAFAPSGTPITKAPGPVGKAAYEAGIAGATARATGVGGIDVSRAEQVSESIQPSEAAIQLTQSVDDLADQIHSGKFVDAISKAAAAAGLSSDTYARQILKKDLGQIQARAISSAPTDDSRATILSGYPDATSDPQTIHTAMDYARGSFRQNVARGQLLNSYQQAHPDLSGFQHADDTLTGSVDPLMTEFQALQTPQQRISFYQRNFKSAQEAQAFKNKVQGVSHITGAGNGP